MATPSKTQGTSLLAWQNIASTGVVLSSAVDVSNKFQATFFIRFGRGTGTAFTTGWPNFRIEGSAKAIGNEAWIPLIVFQPVVGVAIANTTLNGAIIAGATTATVTAATNIAAGDIVFLGHTTDVTKFEISRVKSVSGAVVTFEEAITYAHDNTALVTDQAEMWLATIDLGSVGRVRVVADNAGSGQAISVEALMTTEDSIG